MYDERPSDWEQAVEIDDHIRDMSPVMVRQEVFVCSKLIPLKDLPDKDFMLKRDEQLHMYNDADDWSCDKGYCFI